MLGKRLRVKVLGNGEDIEAHIALTDDPELGWRAAVTAEWHGEARAHETAWFHDQRDVLAAVATWLRSHFNAKTACLVAVTGSKQAA